LKKKEVDFAEGEIDQEEFDEIKENL